MPTEYPNPLLVPVNKGSKSSNTVQNPNFTPVETRLVPHGDAADSAWVTDPYGNPFLPRGEEDAGLLPPNYVPQVAAPTVPPTTPEFRQVPGFDDQQFAAQAMDDFDSIQASIDGVIPSAQEPAPEPYVNVNPAYQTPISQRPTDRSWMFEQRPGRDTGTSEPRTYRPAPVVFNNTNASNWGSAALDRRPGNNGPAASTVRFYQRALDRAQNGSRADIRRVTRLPQRINARPTNRDDAA